MMGSSRRRSALAAGVILGGFVVSAAVWAGITRGAPDGRGARSPAGTTESPVDAQLLIQNVRIAPASDADDVIVKFDLTWSSTGFPGFRECTWRAFGDAGNEVGNFTDLVAALSPSEDLSVRFPVSAAAAAVDATCGERLDVGQPYAYEITIQRVSSETDPMTGDPDVAVVTFDATWQGEGVAGAVDCTFVYLDSDGAEVGADQTSFFALAGSLTGAEHRFQSARFVEVPPVSAEVTCVPFEG